MVEAVMPLPVYHVVLIGIDAYPQWIAIFYSPHVVCPAPAGI
jgi:hypothetical protein